MFILWKCLVAQCQLYPKLDMISLRLNEWLNESVLWSLQTEVIYPSCNAAQSSARQVTRSRSTNDDPLSGLLVMHNSNLDKHLRGSPYQQRRPATGPATRRVVHCPNETVSCSTFKAASTFLNSSIIRESVSYSIILSCSFAIILL